MGRILVLGGTRFFGRELVQQLQEAGQKVIVVSRGNAPVPEGVEHWKADRKDPEQLQAVLQGDFDAVVDNIAYDAQEVRQILQILKGRTGHYVFTSSGVAYFGGPRAPFSEEHGPSDLTDSEPDDSFGWRYTVGKIEAEKALLGQEEVPFTIVRPPVVVGANDPTLRLWYYVQRILDGQPVLLVDGGQHLFHLADSRDLARGIADILQQGSSTFGEAYNLCQADCLSLEELIQAAAKAVGRSDELKLVNVPSGWLKKTGLSYDNPLAPSQPPILMPPWKAIRQWGFAPRPILEAIADASLWHQEHTQENSAGYENRHLEIQWAQRFQEAVEALLPAESSTDS